MPTRPDDWPRVREIFEAALALPPDARRSYVAKTCGRDDGLHQQVEGLLDSHERANSFLETPVVPSLDDATITRNLQGNRIGPYLFGPRIGAGGMGEVYKALDTRLDRPVAIKVLPAHVAGDRQARDRFEREARAVAALNHPHICTLHDVGEAPSPQSSALSPEPIRFLVMEYIEGTTLDVTREPPIEPARVAEIGAQVCDALEAAHAKGIVHRDVKPFNIMLTPRGQQASSMPSLSSSPWIRGAPRPDFNCR
jgi:serine/threonine protein kinase